MEHTRLGPDQVGNCALTLVGTSRRVLLWTEYGVVIDAGRPADDLARAHRQVGSGGCGAT